MTRRCRRDRGDGPDVPGTDERALTPPPGLVAAVLPSECEEFALVAWDGGGTLDVSVLTESEREVVRLCLEGVPDVEIAAHRGTSARTVARQIEQALPKVGVRTRFELLAKAASSPERRERSPHPGARDEPACAE